MNSQSATLRQWRQHLINLPNYLGLDGRTKQARKYKAQRCLLIAMATDEELNQMAKLEADFFDMPFENVLKDLRKSRDDHKKTVDSWKSNL